MRPIPRPGRNRICPDTEFGFGSDCIAVWRIVAWFMTDDVTQTGGEKGSIHDRVQALREKACDLSETLDKVEENLQDAQREAKE